MKLNLIVICIDTLRADIIGEDQSMSFVNTPNLDRLAREGVTFTRCYAEGLMTIPVRRCLFTGVPSFPWRFDTPSEGMHLRVGHGWHPIPHDQQTMAEILHDEGYVTGLIAATYHLFKPTCNFTRGFLSWEFVRGQENDPARAGPLDEVDLSPYLIDGGTAPANHPTLAQYLLNMRDRSREEDYNAARVFGSGANWLADNHRNGPFFLWIDSFSPHEFWDPPRRYADAYFARPGGRDFIYPQVLNGLRSRDHDDVMRTKALYYGYVTFVDEWVGRFLASLDDLDLWDQSIVMLVSDHGTELMEKGVFGKYPDRLYPCTTRMNWIVRHPGGPRGRRLDGWVQSHDFFPTAMSLLGVGVDPGAGHDHRPALLNGSAGVGEREYVATGCRTWACVRDEQTSVHIDLRERRDQAIRWIYDLDSDSAETNDLSKTRTATGQVALDRLEKLTGALPAQFDEYEPLSQGRYDARMINSFAPIRYGKRRDATDR